MGRKLVLTGTALTDTDAPRLIDIDALESSGSLVLVDPTHPAGAWASGVPSNGGTVPNLLASRASALGVSVPTVDVVVGAGWTGGKGLLERTTKGGLHGVVSRTLADTTTTAYVSLPASVRTYLLANPTHDIYLSSWVRVTRQQTQNTYVAVLGNLSGVSTNYLMYARLAANSPATGRVAALTTGPTMMSNHAASWTGTAPGSAANMLARAMFVGASNFTGSSTAARGLAGLVQYRVYLEDLTVSGRTYAEVDALDDALYTTEVLTVGGRYYGDTFTDPATIT
jgi:hypothetical protein